MRIWNFCKRSLTLFFLLFSFLLLNVFQILGFPLFFVSKRFFKRYQTALCGLCGHAIVFWMLRVYKVKPSVEGLEQIQNKDENALIISNHQAMSDIVVILYFAHFYHRIHRLKYFAKASFRHVPGPGWGMRFIDCIFLSRDWKDDSKKIKKTFSKFRKEKIPFWLVNFSEGTRFTPKKLKLSQEFCRQNNIPLTTKVLYPRYKGFIATLEGLEGVLDAVYDLTICYPKLKTPSLWNFFSGQPFRLKVTRYGVEDLPEGDEGRRWWLEKRFREKDQIL